MEVPQITTNTVEAPQTNVNMRGKIKEAPTEVTVEKDPKEALTTPMELVGRSQVNFKAKGLSSKDINSIVDYSIKHNLGLKADELIAAKRGFAEVLEKYDCKSLNELMKYAEEDAWNLHEVSREFINSAGKHIVDPNPQISGKRGFNDPHIQSLKRIDELFNKIFMRDEKMHKLFDDIRLGYRDLR